MIMNGHSGPGAGAGDLLIGVRAGHVSQLKS